LYDCEETPRGRNAGLPATQMQQYSKRMDAAKPAARAPAAFTPAPVKFPAKKKAGQPSR
jgi:hypothetical protein